MNPAVEKVLRSALRVVLALAAICFLLWFVGRVAYTHIPPQRLAADEMLALAAAQKTPIAELFADRGTLEGALAEVTPAATSESPNSKGPFRWEVGLDGTIRGSSARFEVRIELSTPDQGLTWKCKVDPAEYAPSACKVER